MIKPSMTALAFGLFLACPAAKAAPVILRLDQLDAITAGGGVLSVSILAEALAEGPRVLTSTRTLAVERTNIDFATAVAVAYGAVLAQTEVDPQASGGTIDLTGERTITLDHGALSISYGYAIAADSYVAAVRELELLTQMEFRGPGPRFFSYARYSPRRGW